MRVNSGAVINTGFRIIAVPDDIGILNKDGYPRPVLQHGWLVSGTLGKARKKRRLKRAGIDCYYS